MDYQISNKVRYIHKILCETEKIYYSMLKKADLTDSEYVLLFSVLQMGEGCSQKDISENTYISTKTLNSTVKKLKQEDLIQLERGKYPNQYIYLTKKGKEFIRERMLPIIEAENKILEKISDDDFNNFTTIVTKYTNMFSELENI